MSNLITTSYFDGLDRSLSLEVEKSETRLQEAMYPNTTLSLESNEKRTASVKKELLQLEEMYKGIKSHGLVSKVLVESFEAFAEGSKAIKEFLKNNPVSLYTAEASSVGYEDVAEGLLSAIREKTAAYNQEAIESTLMRFMITRHEMTLAYYNLQSCQARVDSTVKMRAWLSEFANVHPNSVRRATDITLQSLGKELQDRHVDIITRSTQYASLINAVVGVCDVSLAAIVNEFKLCASKETPEASSSFSLKANRLVDRVVTICMEELYRLHPLGESARQGDVCHLNLMKDFNMLRASVCNTEKSTLQLNFLNQLTTTPCIPISHVKLREFIDGTVEDVPTLRKLVKGDSTENKAIICLTDSINSILDLLDKVMELISTYNEAITATSNQVLIATISVKKVYEDIKTSIPVNTVVKIEKKVEEVVDNKKSFKDVFSNVYDSVDEIDNM